MRSPTKSLASISPAFLLFPNYSRGAAKLSHEQSNTTKPYSAINWNLNAITPKLYTVTVQQCTATAVQIRL